ncbi:MAG: phosphotransferase [Candidatus Hydrogenedentota bacterium]
MTDLIPFEDHLQELIETNYGLKVISAPEHLPHVHQNRHRKLTVETEQGRFLIKTYDATAEALDNMWFQHRLSRHLEKHGLPVAHIQPTLKGPTITRIEDWAMELQQFVAGKSMQVTPKSLIASARALGKLHWDCRDFPCPERDTRMWRFSEVPRELFASLFESARKIENSSRVISQCDRIALFLREAGNDLDLRTRDTFETGLIHGDWHSGNLIYQGDRLNAIIDLEFAGDGCYLEDLAYAISNLCVRTTVDTQKLNQRTDLLLHYYTKYRTLSPQEEHALYYAVGIKHVVTVCYQILQMKGKVAGYDAAQWMEKLDAQTQWLSDRAAKIHFGW